jgi:hypothetical protein
VELAPGITLHPVGGHAPGMQFVRVHTRRGWVVLASLREHGGRPAVHRRLSYRRDARRL